MNSRLHSLWPVALLAIAIGCSPAPPPANSNSPAPTSLADSDTLVQFSLLSALAADDYLGDATLKNVLAEGDFGIGTFDRLDGEMIVLEGKIYQALADGTVRAANLDGTTPFAVVTRFQEDGRVEKLSAATLDDLDAQIDRQLPHRNLPYALKITGEFAVLTIRSVPAQSPPFEPLVDVVKRQVTWEKQNIRGTFVGFRCPEWMGTINVAGYHWHFVSDDHQIGGHVLGCDFQNATLAYDECDSVDIRLPTNKEFDDFDASDVTEKDVDNIERLRTQPQK